MKILYLAAGLLIYLSFIALITKILGQNSINPDQRRMDRRHNTEYRRKNQRNVREGEQRVKERRSVHGDIHA
ncbi:MAG: hypothetical protein ABI475_06205 [Methylophilaceae bacterium]